jgi:hypothetical protein
LDEDLGTPAQMPIRLNSVPNSEAFLRILKVEIRKHSIAFYTLPGGGRRVRGCFLGIENAFAKFVDESAQRMEKIKQMADTVIGNIPVVEKPTIPPSAKLTSIPE